MASISTNKLSGGKKSYTVYYRDQMGRSREKTFRKVTWAREFKSRAEFERHRGVLVDRSGSKKPVDEVVMGFMTSAGMQWTDSTRLRNESLVRVHIIPRFRGSTVASVTPADVQEMVARLSITLNPDTVRKAYRLLASAFEWAIDQSLLGTSPCRGIRLPAQEHREMRFLTFHEVQHLAAAIDPRYRAFVLLGALTGLRPGELRALRDERLNLLHRQLRVEETLGDVNGKPMFSKPKTARSRRTIELGQTAVEVMTAHLASFPPASEGLVFTSPKGLPIRETNFRRRVWQPAVEASVGPPCRMHDLRHTHAAHLIAQKEDSLVIRDRLGHGSITTTLDHYGHLFAGRDRQAAERLDAEYVRSGVGNLLG